MPTATATRPVVEDLITDNVALAEKIAYDYLSRAPRHADADDIMSAALLGLVEAAQRFDTGRGIPFPKWASARIYGQVVDAARAADPLSRGVRSRANQLRSTEEQLTSALGRTPGEAVLAEKSGLPVETIRQIRADMYRGISVSIDATLPDQPDNFAVTLIDADPSPLESLERRERDAYLRDAVALLPERLREVIEAHFTHGQSNGEIAERLGVTPQRVSQLRAEALRTLRAGVLAQYDEDEHTAGHTLPAPVDGPGSGHRFRVQQAQASYAAAIAARRTYADRLSYRPVAGTL